eukprot:TRINITY_DN24972_c0_g1_i1.p2 TRINITY_DN24972_c0_g1~~TRINITY_DN24972_c0_g1_i1.p2  ORF type:complete len:135 (-),score=19.76 TRINITY_DN24972_c0_g1_i1:696-1100(-)
MINSSILGLNFRYNMRTLNRRVAVVSKHLLSTETPTARNNHTCGMEERFCLLTWEGIVAMVGNEPVHQVLIEGLRLLESRGYDSAGISTISEGNLITTKYASKGKTNNALDMVQSAIEPHTTAKIGNREVDCGI